MLFPEAHDLHVGGEKNESMREIIKTETKPADQYDLLLQSIEQALRHGRDQVAYAVSRTILETYWKIGQSIIEHEQKGLEKAEYGSDVLNRLSADLSVRYGKGFSRGNIFYMRKLYLTYQKVQTLSELLCPEAVHYRSEIRQIGHANLVCAFSRLPYVGRERAVYTV